LYSFLYAMNTSDTYPDFLDTSSDIEASVRFLSLQAGEYRTKIQDIMVRWNHKSLPNFLDSETEHAYVEQSTEKYKNYIHRIRNISPDQLTPENWVQLSRIQEDIQQFRDRYYKLLTLPKISFFHLRFM